MNAGLPMPAKRNDKLTTPRIITTTNGRCSIRVSTELPLEGLLVELDSMDPCVAAAACSRDGGSMTEGLPFLKGFPMHQFYPRERSAVSSRTSAVRNGLISLGVESRFCRSSAAQTTGRNAVQTSLLCLGK